MTQILGKTSFYTEFLLYKPKIEIKSRLLELAWIDGFQASAAKTQTWNNKVTLLLPVCCKHVEQAKARLAKHCLQTEGSRKFNAIYNYSILSAALKPFLEATVCGSVCASTRASLCKCIKDHCCSLDPQQQSTNYRVGSFPVGIY